MQSIVLNGSERKIGFKHGEEGKEKIVRSLENYERLFYGYQKMNWSQVQEEAKTYLPAIERYDISLVEEMEGIAKGAGVDFVDILALNARSEIALAGQQKAILMDGCTSFGIASPLTSDTIIGQNWDWIEEQKENLLLLQINRETKPNIMMITEAGIIGKIGFNEHSVGVCLNALVSDRKRSEVPIHIGLRGILDSENLQRAIKKVHNGQMASAANFLIGYSQGPHKGMVLQTEVSPFGIDYINDDSHYGVHSNHICSNKLKEHIKEQNMMRYSDSVIRYRRAKQLVEKSILDKEEITVDTFKEWLKDDFNSPASVNRYINKDAPNHEQSLTIFSVVMNLTKLEMHYCVGMPIDTPFEVKYIEKTK